MMKNEGGRIGSRADYEYSTYEYGTNECTYALARIVKIMFLYRIAASSKFRRRIVAKTRVRNDALLRNTRENESGTFFAHSYSV